MTDAKLGQYHQPDSESYGTLFIKKKETLRKIIPEGQISKPPCNFQHVSMHHPTMRHLK